MGWLRCIFKTEPQEPQEVRLTATKGPDGKMWIRADDVIAAARALGLSYYIGQLD
jgi:hypothetical protein